MEPNLFERAIRTVPPILAPEGSPRWPRRMPAKRSERAPSNAFIIWLIGTHSTLMPRFSCSRASSDALGGGVGGGESTPRTFSDRVP